MGERNGGLGFCDESLVMMDGIEVGFLTFLDMLITEETKFAQREYGDEGFLPLY